MRQAEFLYSLFLLSDSVSASKAFHCLPDLPPRVGSAQTCQCIQVSEGTCTFSTAPIRNIQVNDKPSACENLQLKYIIHEIPYRDAPCVALFETIPHTPIAFQLAPCPDPLLRLIVTSRRNPRFSAWNRFDSKIVNCYSKEATSIQIASDLCCKNNRSRYPFVHICLFLPIVPPWRLPNEIKHQQRRAAEQRSQEQARCILWPNTIQSSSSHQASEWLDERRMSATRMSWKVSPTQCRWITWLK